MKSLLIIVAATLFAVAAAVPAVAGAQDTVQAAGLVADVRQALSAAGWDDTHWGVVIVSLTSGETLFAHNAERPLTPASNMKLYTTAAALHYLGPEHRFATYVTALGPVRDGVVEGDLLVYGTGDPTIGDRFHDSKLAVLEALADSLVALGVRRVAGDVVGDASYFEGSGVSPGWGDGYNTHTYAAPASALSFNENIVTLRVTGGAADGDPARILFVPAGRVELVNRAVTGSGRSTLQVRRESYESPVELEGRVPRGGSGVWRAVPVTDPAAFAASAFAEVLQARGIEVGGHPRSIAPRERSPITSRRVFAPAFDGGAPVQVLATHHSPPLREILAIINQRSHNLYAESVIRLVGRVTQGTGSVEGGAAAIVALLEEAGLSDPALRIDDGSGLSRLNRSTPRSIIRLLAYMDASPHAAEYRATLPEAAVSRGLRRMHQTDAAGNLRAKTGTISGVSALSGYVGARNGERLAFSIISNDVPSTYRAKRAEDRIGARLAAFDRPVTPSREAVAATTRVAEAADDTAPADREAHSEGLALAAADTSAGPPPAAAPPAESATRTYVIRQGDTLTGIARSHGIGLSELRAANPDVNPRRLIPGRSLEIPVNEAGAD